MARVILTDVGVDFTIHNSHSRSLQLQLFSTLGGKLAEHKRAVVVRALSGINLALTDGDRVGIIGHNGAGKTTLLRVLAGVYKPSRGRVSIEGKISSFTDISLGMDMEATGLENIIFRCIFMGLTFAQARELSPSIEEFTDLGEYLRLPVRTYSSGMFLRLAFAISTSIQPDIIIMDEMISAGDAQFVDKAQERLSILLQKTKVMVLASHDSAVLQRLCNKLIWLQHGEVRKVGPFEEVYEMYRAAKPA